MSAGMVGCDCIRLCECLWKSVCGVDQIRRVVEHLGDHTQDQELRNNLVTSLLADRKVPDNAGPRTFLLP